MPRLLALVIAASIFGISTAAFSAPELKRVRGTVKSISDTVLVVHTTSGTDETLDLTAKTGYLAATPFCLHVANSFLATEVQYGQWGSESFSPVSRNGKDSITLVPIVPER